MKVIRWRALLVAAMCASLLAAGMPSWAGPSRDDRWALLIGVDTFQGRTRHNVGGVGDVELFQELLQRNGWRRDRVRVITNERATQAAIREGLEWIASRCTSPNSWCVVHYSGHTKQMNGGGGGEGLHEYLWPHDNRFISDDEFASYMRRLNGYAWIDVSACEAAGFDNGISSPKRLFTAASAEHEKGYEDPGWATSVWTGLLVREGILEGKGDANGDGHVTLAEAYNYAAERAPQLTHRNPTGPQHAYSAGGNLHDWFTPPPPPPQVATRASCILLIICL